MKRTFISAILILATAATILAQDLSGKWLAMKQTQNDQTTSGYMVIYNNNDLDFISESVGLITEGVTLHMDGSIHMGKINVQGDEMTISFSSTGEPTAKVYLNCDEERKQFFRDHPEKQRQFEKELVPYFEAECKKQLKGYANKYRNISDHYQIIFCENGVLRLAYNSGEMEWARVGDAPQKKSNSSKSGAKSKGSSKKSKGTAKKSSRRR